MFKGGDNLSLVKIRAKKSPSSNLIDIRLIREYFDILSSFKVQDSVKVNSIKDAFNCEASIDVHMVCCNQVYEGQC